MPPDFNPSFVPPQWAWWVVLYFFLGGITGGTYFAAAWLDLFGDRGDRGIVRMAHLLAFPLILLSAGLLIVDLGRPERFLNMIVQSERFPLPMFKPYSPMSAGSLILALFGAISFISFLDAVFTRGRERWLHRAGSVVGKVISFVGGIAGLALAGYTGWLLNVTNEPVWGTSPFISALFVFSGISTGIAAILIAAARLPDSTRVKLEEADNYLMGFELLTLLVFLLTLGSVGVRFVVGQPLVVLLFAVTIIVGLLLPFLLHLRPRLLGGHRTATAAAAALALVGGFALRWAVLAGPQGITLQGISL
ncbi:MAG: polysulfide reductase NrfD [Chloroflexi bacterium]|nr:polysulfide reductase NrfD [Chloroflexota bacterium]